MAPVEGIWGSDDKGLRQNLCAVSPGRGRNSRGLLSVLWLPQPWEHLLSLHCRRGNQPRAFQLKGETQNFASWTLWCLWGICPFGFKNSLVFLLGLRMTGFVSVEQLLHKYRNGLSLTFPAPPG